MLLTELVILSIIRRWYRSWRIPSMGR